MIAWLLSYRFLERPISVGVISAATMVLGVLSFSLVPITMEDRGDAHRLSISVSWPGVSAITVEKEVTAPLESLVQGIGGISNLSSTTSTGQAHINAEFFRDVDLQMAELELSEKIYQFGRSLPARASWPLVSRSDFNPLGESHGFVSLQVLSQRDVSELRRLVDEAVRLPLLSIDGVRAVGIQGGSEKTVAIEIDWDLARRWEVDFNLLSAALGAHDIKTLWLGDIETHREQTHIHVRGGAENINALKKMALKRTATGRVVYLENLATVRYKSESPEFLYRTNGFNAISLQIDRVPSSDMVSTARMVREKVEELAAALPKDVRIAIIKDRGSEIAENFRFLLQRSTAALFFIAIVLLVFFRRIEVVALIISSIFLASLGAIALFYVFGINISLVTLAGFTIGFGVIVDNAIVVYDSIDRHVLDCEQSNGIKAAVESGARDVVRPLIVSNLTTLGAFTPVVFLSEDLQQYFLPFILSLGSTLLLALFSSLVLIPTFFCQLAKWKRASSMGDAVSLYRSYCSVLKFCAERRKWFFFFVIWAVGVPIWLLPDDVSIEGVAAQTIDTRKGYEQWLEEKKKGALYTEPYIGTSVQIEPRLWDRLNKNAANLYNELWDNPAMRLVKPVLFSITGGAVYSLYHNAFSQDWHSAADASLLREVSDDFSLVAIVEMPYNSHISRMDAILRTVEKQLLDYAPYIEAVAVRSYKRYGLVQVRIKEEYKSSQLPSILYETLVAHGANIGGVGFRVYGQGFDLQGRGLDGGTGWSKQWQIKGYNFTKVSNIAEDLAQRLRQRRSRRIKDIQIDGHYGPPQYEVLVDIHHNRTAPLGIDHTSVIDNVHAKLDGGRVVARFQMDRREYKATVVDTAAFATNLRNLGGTLLEGGAARIRQVSHISKQHVQTEIKRENQQYRKEVGCAILGDRNYSEYLLNGLEDGISLPYGYSIERRHNAVDLSQSEKRELSWALVLSCGLVWMIAAALFESWIMPIMVLAAIPLALIGVAIGFASFDVQFNQGGYASLLLLMGISVNNSILLLNHISNALKKSTAPAIEAITRASFERLRPIAITTITTIAGFLPLLLHGEQGDSWYIFAIGTSSGLLASSILLVVVVPLCVLHSRFASLHRMEPSPFRA